MEAHGLGAAKLNACGYSLGTTFAPNWMDWPMAYAGQPYRVRPGNVFFLHMILFDEAARPRHDPRPHLARHRRRPRAALGGVPRPDPAVAPSPVPGLNPGHP